MPKIKSEARVGSPSYTLSYIAKEQSESELGTHNLLSSPTDIRGLVKEFKENKSDRGIRTYYHDHVSFHPEDRAKCNQKLMRDFAQEYIDKNYASQQVFWGVHREKQHIHVHFCVSATGLEGKKLHFSAKVIGVRDRLVQEFARNRGLQYMTTLELSNRKEKSFREKGMHSRQKKRAPEWRSTKELLHNKVDSVIKSATVLTKADFKQELEREGLLLSDRETGIKVNNRNYRFKTLGYDNDLYKAATFKNYRSEQTQELAKEKEERLAAWHKERQRFKAKTCLAQNRDKDKANGFER